MFRESRCQLSDLRTVHYVWRGLGYEAFLPLVFVRSYDIAAS